MRAATLALCVLLPTSGWAAPTQTGTLSLKTGATGAPVAIDGQVVGVAPLPGPWTLPAGEHTIEVRPKGGAPEQVTVTVVAGQTSEVELARQAVAPVPEVPVGPRERVVHTGAGFSLATAGYITTGVGLAVGATALLFGLNANSKADEARKLDKADPANERSDQLALVDEADRAALIANVSLGLGSVLTVAGVSLVLLAADGPLGPLSVAPAPGGLTVGGAF